MKVSHSEQENNGPLYDTAAAAAARTQQSLHMVRIAALPDNYLTVRCRTPTPW